MLRLYQLFPLITGYKHNGDHRRITDSAIVYPLGSWKARHKSRSCMLAEVQTAPTIKALLPPIRRSTIAYVLPPSSRTILTANGLWYWIFDGLRLWSALEGQRCSSQQTLIKKDDRSSSSLVLMHCSRSTIIKFGFPLDQKLLMWSNSAILPPLNQELVRLMMIPIGSPHPWYCEVSGTITSVYPELSPNKFWTPRAEKRSLNTICHDQKPAPLFFALFLIHLGTQEAPRSIFSLS